MACIVAVIQNILSDVRSTQRHQWVTALRSH